MSSASKSKSKDKKAGKDGGQKVSSKPSGSGVNPNMGVPASAYNPFLGTFQTLESVPTTSSSSLHSNSRFKNIDETDTAGADYDSASNNGSWSGDSEDHKEKASNPPAKLETVIPGADNDKREKIRQKNERKHQRQKERRAQELHERCSHYLMSRKLEVLAQQLVAMGISQERATMALILNEGKVEESIHWLFDDDGCKEAEKPMDSTPENLKIDISEELSRIVDMEVRYKCTKQEVERAVVAAEGGLEKAEEMLRAQKQDQSSARPDENIDPPTLIGGKFTVGQASHNSTIRPQPKQGLHLALQQTQNSKDFDYTKVPAVMGGLSASLNQNVQPFRGIEAKLEWAKLQQAAVYGSNPAMSYSMASPVQAPAPPTKEEAHYVSLGNEFKNFPQQPIREPVAMMQRSQSVNSRQVPASSISSTLPETASSWYPTTSVEMLKSIGFVPHIPSTRSLSPNNLSSNQMYQQLHYQHQGRVNSHWTRNNASPTLAAASSLGLFSGLGSSSTSGASSAVDWSTGGGSGQLDYSSIDWSLDPSLSSPRPNRLWVGSTSFRNPMMYDSTNANGFGAKSSIRLASDTNGISIMGLREGRVEPSMAASREWTSPFEERDLFSLPRQFVSSPSL